MGLELTKEQLSQIMDWKWQLIASNINPETMQQLSATHSQIFTTMYLKWLEGQLRIVGSRKHKFVVVIVPKNEFVCEVHIFSDGDTAFSAVKGAKACLKWIWDNTDYIRVESRSPLTKIAALAKRIGMKHEGTRLKSYVTNNGTKLDEYEYGVNRPEE